MYFYTVSHPITIMFSDERNYTLSLLGTSCKHCIHFIHFTYFTCVLSPMTVHVIIDVYDILVLSRLCCTDYCRLSFLLAAHFHCYTSSLLSILYVAYLVHKQITLLHTALSGSSHNCKLSYYFILNYSWLYICFNLLFLLLICFVHLFWSGLPHSYE